MYRHAVVNTPVARWVLIARGTVYSNRFHSSPAAAAFPILEQGRRHIGRFEACSTFTHVTACRLAASPKRHICLEGSDGFVTSTVAPIATGWSDPVAGWELHPLKINTFPRRTLAASPFRSPVPVSVSDHHATPRCTRPRVTPLAITPMWLNACG